MLTVTPPEVQEDEIQVDDAEKDSVLLRMSPTRVKAKSKERNCMGFNYIQLIVGMIIFVALSRIVGPPAFRMITRARSTALEANIQTAAETVRNVLAIDPAKRGDPGSTSGGRTAGQPTDTFLAALTDDAPFNWEDDWALAAEDDSDTIKVQFINKSATQAVAAGTTAPSVGWLLNAWDAVRIQARNQDGAWACALIVLKPDTDELDTDTSASSVDIVDITGGDVASNTHAIGVAIADARLRGVWFSSGATYTAGDDDQHCSPTATNSSAVTAGCSVGTHTTVSACHDAGGAFVPPIAASATIDPLPGSADTWGITTDRALTRNI